MEYTKIVLEITLTDSELVMLDHAVAVFNARTGEIDRAEMLEVILATKLHEMRYERAKRWREGQERAEWLARFHGLTLSKDIAQKIADLAQRSTNLGDSAEKYLVG